MVKAPVVHCFLARKWNELACRGAGMGEPLANPRVFETLKLLTDPRAFGISARRLNISTSGVLPGIKKLNEQHPQVRCRKYHS